MNKKTKATMAAGFVALLIGSIGAAYMGSRQGSGKGSGGATVEVYVAAGPVAAGTAGSAALGEGRIVTKAVRPAERPGNAMSQASEISAQVATAPIAAGALITTNMFAAPQTRIGTFVIPPGKRALALELEPVAGVAGFAGAGDHIDVYGVSKGEGATPAGVRLVLQSVEVLNVNGTGLPTAQGQPDSPNLIYLVAVTPVDAERLIYLTEFEKLYMDLVPNGEAPVKTPGTGPAGALAV